jgi:large subunit ribosomal protein L18e
MAKRTGPTNPHVQGLLEELSKVTLKNKFWARVAEELSASTRSRRIVNLYKIDKYAQDGETILVPGKVLSVGELSKKVEVAALNFSEEAKQKVLAAKGKTLTISELFHKNPEGKKVRILG